MTTTQRSESMNAFFDGYVHSRTTLSEFVEQYDNALRSKVEKELKADARSFSKVIPTTTKYEIEEQMQNVYTIEKFQEIQKELTKKIYCEIIDVQDEIQDGVRMTRYDVQQEIWYYRLPFVEDEDGNSTDEDATTAAGSDQEDIVEVNNIPIVEEGEEDELNPKAKKVMKHVVFKVWYEKDECKVKCSCMFEFGGLLCTHMLCVLLRNKVTSIPERYILRRWRKDVKLAHSKVSLSSDSWQLTPERKRYKELCDCFADLVDIASRDDDECNDIKKWIGEQLKLVTEKVPNTAEEVIHKEVNNVIEVTNPRVVPTKGRPCKNTSKPKVLQEVPTQQNINPIHEQYHQYRLNLQLHTIGQFQNTQNIQYGVSQSCTGGHLGIPHISPYGQVVNVAPQQLDNIFYAPAYGGFQLHEGAQETNVYHLTSYPEHRYRPL
ncbi:protein FAR-RED ELONGATED HYPOCOTYL 3-like [Papaver somniferum]|uniref:protein FAR-RED ELONGATED HYPOCOTYL 3-like n=1 Tax=Papaver somniferum TaxID=3469 RepID=UPI000E704B6B|nr:protein FAR-RED ELONGATED HYPOCOTYL 3-like [Papaver somniferum]